MFNLFKNVNEPNILDGYPSAFDQSEYFNSTNYNEFSNNTLFEAIFYTINTSLGNFLNSNNNYDVNNNSNIYNLTLLANSSDANRILSSSELTTEQILFLRTLAKVLCSFSIVGIIFVLFIFVYVKSVRSFVLELAVWLCLTNLFFNINVYFPIDNINDDVWCLTQGLISSFSDLSTMLWTTIIGFFSFFSVVKSGFIDRNKRRLRLVFILIAFFIPGIFTLIITNFSKFGHAGVWCWIKSGENDEYIYFQIAYYVLTWIIVFCNSLFVILLICNLRKLNFNNNNISRYINKLKLYPLVQIISLMPATINRIICLMNKNTQIYWLMIIQVVFDSLTGLVFSIVYGFNPNIRAIIYDFFTGFCSKENLIESESNDSDSIDHSNRRRIDPKSYDMISSPADL